MSALIDITGQRFGRLTVIRISHRGPNRKLYWLCRCDCGEQSVVYGWHLRTGLIRSCGCLRREVTRDAKTIHGHARLQKPTKTYQSWQAMIRRCQNPAVKAYRDYGGRGISVCARWHSFENFLIDMGEIPLGYSIERIDVNGNYELKNCKWIPRRDQSKNRRPRSTT